MPREAIKPGAAGSVLALSQVAGWLQQRADTARAATATGAAAKVAN